MYLYSFNKKLYNVKNIKDMDSFLLYFVSVQIWKQKEVCFLSNIIEYYRHVVDSLSHSMWHIHILHNFIKNNTRKYIFSRYFSEHKAIFYNLNVNELWDCDKKGTQQYLKQWQMHL